MSWHQAQDLQVAGNIQLRDAPVLQSKSLVYRNASNQIQGPAPNEHKTCFGVAAKILEKSRDCGNQASAGQIQEKNGVYKLDLGHQFTSLAWKMHVF